ncbi:MAG: response regulator [Candidatus Nitrosopumilus sp. bin_68KS]
MAELDPLRFSKILIVDDSKAFREKIKRILSDAKIGFYYYNAEDGIDGFAKYVTYRPHIVIMDLNMPNGDGVKATKAIMNYDPSAKVIIVSAREDRKAVDEVINNAGAKDYILKPFDSGQVIMAVSKLLAKNRLIRKHI